MNKKAQDRRQFLKGTALATAYSLAPRSPLGVSQGAPALRRVVVSESAQGSSFWEEVAAQYDVDRSITNLENAYWGIMARPVEAAYLERTKFVNRVNVAYVRDAVSSRPYTRDLQSVRQRIASALGCKAEEIAPTRSGTEALQNLIVNYNRVEAGDAIIYADLDFDAMQFAMDFLALRRGARVVKFVIPEPAGIANILGAYEAVLRATPKAKLLLVTHVSHRTGLRMPVAEIVNLARGHGVDVVVDAAQSWGLLDFRVADLGADFVGFSLHKWIGAPLGCGCMYIKALRLKDINPHFENRDWPAEDIRARVLTGTTNFAALLTVPDALSFHEHIGPSRKEARLRYLRDYWVSRVRGLKGVQILTPDEPSLNCGITSFRLTGRLSAQDLQKILVERYKILTASRKGIAGGDAVRVTPALYTREADMDRLVAALRQLSAGA